MRRIGLTSAVMSSLRKVWNNRQLCVDTKVHVYRALVQSVMLHGSETWTLLASDIKKLEVFHLRCQRQLLCVSWRDHITNEAICKQTKLTSLTELLSRMRTSLFGHIARLDAAVPAHQSLWQQTSISTGRNPVQAGRDCQVFPGKHGPLRFQMILECHRVLTFVPSFVMALEERRYGLTLMMMMMTKFSMVTHGERRVSRVSGTPSVLWGGAPALPTFEVPTCIHVQPNFTWWSN